MKNRMNYPWIMILTFLGACLLYACSGVGAMENQAVTEAFPGNEMEELSTEKNNQQAQAFPDAEEGEEQPKITTWKRSGEIPNTAKLFVGDEEQLALKGQQISVKVEGFRARVVMDYYFHNDNNQQLEGTFKLKLPTDATPFYLAFGESELLNTNRKEVPYVDYDDLPHMNLDSKNILEDRSRKGSHLREAKVAPKGKAAQGYTQTVTRKVDPALMEWAGADIFNCRVYPLLPHRTHHIVVGYDINLARVGNDLVYELDFPKEESDLRVNMEFEAREGLQLETDRALEPDQSKGISSLHFRNPGESNFQARYNQPGTLLMSESSAKHPHFAASFMPQLPVLSTNDATKDAVLLLDLSLSSNPDRFNIWLKMAEALLAENPNHIERFSVLCFNIDTHWWKQEWTTNTPQNREAFLNFANSLSLEGASDVGLALKTASNPVWLSSNTPKTLFLLSDGAITWGEANSSMIIDQISENDQVFGFQTGLSGSDIPFLSQVTRSTGGTVIPVLGEQQIPQAARAFTAVPWKIENMEMEGATDLLVAGGSEYLFPGSQVLLAGRGAPDPEDRLTLTITRGAEVKKLAINWDHSSETDLSRRIYGQIATQQLEELGFATEAYAQAYGTHYRIPGKTCSLVMLESDWQYRSFGITPEMELESEMIVHTTRVNHLVHKTRSEMAEALVSAKAGFMAWVETLVQDPAVQLQYPNSLKMLLELIPEKNYHFASKPLNSKVIYNWNAPEDLKAELNQSRMDYEVLEKEALRRKKEYGPEEALVCMSSMIEKNPGDGILARDIGYSAMEWGLSDQAYHLFHRTAQSRPWESQSYHALAQVCADEGFVDLAMVYYEIAMSGRWNPQFGDFRRVVGLDYMRLLRKAERGEVEVSAPDYATSKLQMLQREFGNQQNDVAVVITWNTNNTDIDLHVTEPSGEKCNYMHTTTKAGGHLNWDATNGFGPEMYTMAHAEEGIYKVQAKFFSSNQNRKGTVGTKVYATVYRNMGRPEETVERKTVSLDKRKAKQDIMIFDWQDGYRPMARK